MTSSETLQFFGNTFDATVLTSSGDTITTTATYQATLSVSALSSGYIDDNNFMVSGRNFLLYWVDLGLNSGNTEPQQVTLDLRPEYTIFDTEYIYDAIAGYTIYSTPTAVYNSPSWNWYFGGESLTFDGALQSVNGVLPQCYFNSNDPFDFITVSMNANALTSGYSIRAVFDHLTTYYTGSTYVFSIAIACPYVSDDAVGSSGTPATTAGTDININIDMSETNSLLGSISQSISGFVSGILTGIQNFFIPSHEDFNSFRSTVDAKLEEHFGLAYTAHELIHDAIAGVDTTQIQETITIPEINIPVSVNASGQATQTFAFGGWTVSLKPESQKLSFLYTSLRLIGNIVITLAVINTLRNKFENFIKGNVIVDTGYTSVYHDD